MSMRHCIFTFRNHLVSAPDTDVENRGVVFYFKTIIIFLLLPLNILFGKGKIVFLTNSLITLNMLRKLKLLPNKK